MTSLDFSFLKWEDSQKLRAYFTQVIFSQNFLPKECRCAVQYVLLIMTVLLSSIYISGSSLFSRPSTKPGSVPSILKSHSFTAATEFLASNTVWRFKRGVPLYYQTMMMSSMEDYQVSSVQV